MQRRVRLAAIVGASALVLTGMTTSSSDIVRSKDIIAVPGSPIWFDVNSRGQIAGSLMLECNSTATQNGKKTALSSCGPTPFEVNGNQLKILTIPADARDAGGASGAYVAGLSDNGIIVGNLNLCEQAVCTIRASAWLPNGGVIRFPQPAGTGSQDFSKAIAISPDGRQVLGQAFKDGILRYVRWTISDGVASLAGTLDTPNDNAMETGAVFATDINDRGQAAGVGFYSTFIDGVSGAYLDCNKIVRWDANGTGTVLSPLKPTEDSQCALVDRLLFTNASWEQLLGTLSAHILPDGSIVAEQFIYPGPWDPNEFNPLEPAPESYPTLYAVRWSPTGTPQNLCAMCGKDEITDVIGANAVGMTLVNRYDPETGTYSNGVLRDGRYSKVGDEGAYSLSPSTSSSGGSAYSVSINPMNQQKEILRFGLRASASGSR